VSTVVVLSSSIALAVEHGAITQRQWRGTWTATCPEILGRVGTLPCGSEEEALAECGDLIHLELARQARGAES
jgi:hypothetical protein